MTHPRVWTALPRGSVAAEEITQSKALLERLVGQAVDTFALYGTGRYDAGVRQGVVDA